MKRLAVLTLGWMFMVLGVLGLFLPILQGVLFLIIGLLLLATEYRWARRLLDRVARKYPRVGGLLQRATGYVDRLIQRIEAIGHKGGGPKANPRRDTPL